jgi:hypothetical protein
MEYEMIINGYTEIDQSDEHKDFIQEYTNIKNKTIKDAFKGKDEAGYDVMEIRFTDDTTLKIEEKGQTGHFDAWVYG